MAFSLCGGTVALGAGYDYVDLNDFPHATRMEADQNRDEQVTLSEAFAFADSMVRRIQREGMLSEPSGYTQMCVYPENDASIIFSRN